MSKQAYLIHAGWAAAALGAFVLGSQRSVQLSASSPEGSNSSKKSARPAPDHVTLSPGGPRPASGSRSPSPSRAPGLLAEQFGRGAAGTSDFEALARDAIRDPNPITRRLVFTRLLESLTPENARAIREHLVALGADGEQWRDFNYGWGALAGKEAFDFAAASQERDLNAVLTGWASANPSETIALLDNLPEQLRGQRNDLAASVVAGLADRDPSLATDLVLRLAREGSDNGGQLIDIVAREALRHGSPQDAALWAETLPEGPLRGAALNRIAGTYAAVDLQSATRWAESFASQDYAADAVAQVANRRAREDPADAANWLGGLPAGNGQVAGLRSVFGDWEDRDPVAAGEYLLTMTQSPQRDAAISGFSNGYAWQDPVVAINWAQDIADPALRQDSLTRAGQAYFQRDPDSARAWLVSSGLPPEAQEAVLNPPRRR